jgi:hypothetical protein
MLEAGSADRLADTRFLYFETPKGRMADAIRLGDLGASHERLCRVIRHSNMGPGVWYVGGHNAPSHSREAES